MTAIDSLWNTAFTGSLRASALILCVLLLRLALRGRVPAQCFHVLWVLVAVRLLAPVPSSEWSVFNLLQPRPAEAANAVDARWQVRIGEDSANTAAMPATAPRPQMRAVSSLVPALWLSGAFGQALLLGGAAWCMRRRLRSARPLVDTRVLGLAAECVQQLRLRRPLRIFETAALPGPAVIGLWRPRLLLPCGLAARLSDEDLRFVLLHEGAHLRRHDLAALWLLAAARVVHWFNPLVWLAVRAARTDAELACDETVLRASPAHSPVAYGETLLRLARSAVRPGSLLPSPGIVESRRTLRARMASIGRHTPRKPAQSLFAALLVLGVTLAFGVDEKSAGTPDEPAPAAAEPAPLAAPPVEDRPADPPRRNAVQIEIEARFIELNATLARRLELKTAGLKVSDRAGLNRLVESLAGRGSDVNVLNAQQHADLLNVIGNVGGGTDVLTAPRVTTKSGQRAVIEIIREFRYPTEWAPATIVNGVKGPITPTKFETRNCGVTLEVEPICKDGGTLALHLKPKVVEFLGFLDLETRKARPIRRKETGTLANRTMHARSPTFPVGAPGHPLKSIFSTRQLETDVTLVPGDAVLLTGAREVEDTAPFPSPERARRLIVIVSAKSINVGTPLLDTKPPAEPPVSLSAAAIDSAIFGQQLEPGVPPKGANEVLRDARSMQTNSTNALGTAKSKTITPASAVPGPPATPAEYGVPVPGKPGFVQSPYAADTGYVDVRGFPRGTEVKDPYTGKILLVP